MDTPKAPSLRSRLLGAFGSLTPMAESANLLVCSGFVGLAAGLGAVGFIYLLRTSSWLFLDGLKGWLGIGGGLSLLFLPLIPALGGLLVAPLIMMFPAEAKGLGVPEVIECSALRGGNIRPRTIILRALAGAISIGSGGSAGREGPIVQIGAAVGSTVGQVLRWSGARLRLLVGCGTAAGIAATFNAPLAGMIFSMEIILGEFSLRVFSPILVAAVVATIVSRAILGSAPAFSVPSYSLVNFWELAIYLVLGLFCGVTARGFVRLLYTSKDWFEDSMLRVPRMLKPALGGLLVGCAAVFFPHVLGNGYPTVASALEGKLPLYLMALLLFFKMGATASTLGSGGSGGVIAPSLFMGAMLGGSVGSVVHSILPAWTAPKGVYALVGMGAVLAAAAHAPLTSILLIFELTDGYSIMVPVALACLVATAVARRMDADSVYTWKLTRRGVAISGGWEVSLLGSIFVRDVMDPRPEAVPQGMNYREVRRLLDQTMALDHFVVDEEGRLVGLLGLKEFGAFKFEPELRDTVLAKDLASVSPVTLLPSDTLQSALEVFDSSDRDELPVVADHKSQKLVGTLRRQDLLRAYERAVLARQVLK
jgi:CIC family chloride channel protein